MGDAKTFEPRGDAGSQPELEPTAPTPASGAAPEAPLAEPGDQALPEIGARLAGRYLLERLVGRGGMGAIYAGAHPARPRGLPLRTQPAVPGGPAC